MDARLNGKLVLVGAGKMGGAMLEGWLGQGLSPEQVVVQDPAPPSEVVQLLDGHGIPFRDKLSADLFSVPPSVLMMSVKPQVMDDVFASVVPFAGPETVTLSIAAGKTLASFENQLPPERPVVRSIPNTPAAVGRGITACCANAHVTPEQKALCTELLSSIGDVGWVDEEALIDAATAVSGSGPAYVFLMAECLAKAGVDVGLPPDLAQQLADATVSGAGELMRLSDQSPAALRENVTSPHGTTYAALQVLMADDGLQQLLGRAVEAAERRSRELAG